MANIRASVVVTSVLSAALSVGGVTAAAIPNDISAQARTSINLTASIIVIPLKEFERQIATATDSVGPFTVGKVLIDLATATDSVAMSFDKQLTDSVTTSDVINKAFISNVDFDLSDPDIDLDPVSVSDTATATTGKTLVDTSAISETNVKSIGLGKVETLQSSDQIFTIVGKNLVDTANSSDVPVFAIGTVKTDVIETSETRELTFTKGNIPDAVETSELATLNAGLNKISLITAQDTLGSLDIGKNPSDSLAGTDAIDSVSVDKVLADSVTVIDVVARTLSGEIDYDRTDADVDPDPVTVADSSQYNVGLTKTDATSVADIVAISSGKVFAESINIAEVFSAILTLGQSTPIFDFTFIADDKYTYFPVQGTFNNHMIHQPLVNGEFVLTTDPNTGIVYTIRPEAVSYTFGWYGINGNQFN